MEVREQLKEIIEKAKDAAIAAASCRKGNTPPCSVWKSRSPRNSAIIPPMLPCAGQKQRTRAPRQIAEVIVKHIDTPLVAKMDIAGAGFINFFLAADTVYAELEKILKTGPSYGDLPKDQKDRILVEYVSAQPDRPASHRPCQRRSIRFRYGEPAPALPAMTSIPNTTSTTQATRSTISLNPSMPDTSSSAATTQKSRKTATMDRTSSKQPRESLKETARNTWT